MQRSRATELRVGIFVMVALLIGGTVAFTLGDQRNLFSPKATYYAVFEDVGGLRTGSPVHIGGVNVGTVADVGFEKSGKIRVTLEIAQSQKKLVRKGSLATLSNKGMLGDKLITVTAGDGKPLEEGSVIPTDKSASLSDYLDKAGRILSDAQATAENARRATEPFSDPEFGQSVKRTVSNVEAVTRMAAEGDGALQQLLTDRETAKKVSSSLENLQATSRELNRTARSMRAIGQEIERGDGTAHEIIYGDEGTRMVRNFADAAGEIASVLEQVRQGDGTLHKLVYGSQGDSLVANLTQVSEDLKAISGRIREGKGTIGALIKDPSVYEDVKRLVGDLERNEILRSLVRYSIRRDEKVEATEVDRSEGGAE